MEYERACQGFNCQVDYFHLNGPEFIIDNSILDAMDETIDIVFLCYPIILQDS